MSLSAEKLVKRNRHLCGCGHRAVYVRPSNGQVAWRRDHDLCPRCWASSVASARARRFNGVLRVQVPRGELEVPMRQAA
jgi:hypothetical protein